MIVWEFLEPWVKITFAAAAGSAVTVLVQYLLSSRHRVVEQEQSKAARTALLIFEFLDLAEHEQLGVPGFRNIDSRLELLVSGKLNNFGSALAREIRFDIYHFTSGTAPVVNEIAQIPVADALISNVSMWWTRYIRLQDLTVKDKYYKSGTRGIFADNVNGRYYHYHIVFSCKNLQNEDFSTIYCMEKVIEKVNGIDTFKGNRLVFSHHTGKYDPGAEFPKEWRDEIAAQQVAKKEAFRFNTGERLRTGDIS